MYEALHALTCCDTTPIFNGKDNTGSIGYEEVAEAFLYMTNIPLAATIMMNSNGLRGKVL